MVKESTSRSIDFKGLGYSKVGHFKQVRAKIKELEDLSSELAQRHNELEVIINNMTDGLTILDRHFNIVFTNSVQRAMFTPGPLIGEKCHEAFYQKKEVCRDCPAMRTMEGRVTLRGEVVISKGEHAGRCIEWATSPIEGPSGLVERTIMLMRDITDRKEYEYNLMRADRMAAIGLLAAGIAHEINNPLTSIAGFSEGLLKRLGTIPEFKDGRVLAYFQDYLQIINNEAYRCKDIIENLIRFTRSPSEDHEKLDLNRIVNETTTLIRQHAKDNGVKVNIRNEVGINHHWIVGNESELKHMFLNLLNNALDTTEETGMLTVITKSSGTSMQVIISNMRDDTPAELQRQALNPPRTTNPGAGGTPLGLSICYSIMQRHKGDIQVNTIKGKGTYFVLFFPAVSS
jgi:two-component system NtrC family sensor kinase